MTSRRSGLLPIRPTILALGLTVSLGAGFAQAHDPRLDEALQALQKTEALVQAALDVTALPPNAETKYDRQLERVITIIQRVMEQIQAAADLADDALGPSPSGGQRSGEDRARWRLARFDRPSRRGLEFEPDAGVIQRHSQLPKLDVAGSIPVARSNDDAGLQGTCSPAFALMLPLCARSHRVSPALPMRSHADTFVLGSFIDLATSRLPAGRQRQGLRVGSVRAGAGSSRAWKPPKSVRLSRAMAPFGAHHSVV